MAQSSYQLLPLTANIVLSWPFSFSGSIIVTDINDVNPTANGFTITLPNATLASNGQNIIFNNISTYSFQLLANDGITPIGPLIESGDVVEIYLYDSTTLNGLWRVIPFGAGTNAITAFAAESSNDSIIITNGAITPPGGMIDFQLPTSLFNLNVIETVGGFPIITQVNPLTWQTIDLVAGENINITNPDGIAGDPVINLDTVITGLSSIMVGNFTISGSVITSNLANGNIQLSSTGNGQVQINGVEIDPSGDITTAGNLTVTGNSTIIGNLAVTGNITGPITGGLAAWCVFTATTLNSPPVLTQSITVINNINIPTVTAVSAGTYTLNFLTPFATTNYGVLISLSTTDDLIPPVSHGFTLLKNLGSVTIIIVDASGEYVTAVPTPATVSIFYA